MAKITTIGSLRLTDNVVLFDVIVIPEYTVNLLYVNKIIKDSKYFVGFDESKCYIQDLKLKKIVGTSSKSGGLYCLILIVMQNGIVERKHSHLLNVARSLMFQGGIPLCMWPECVLTAIYLINRLPSSFLFGASPFRIVYVMKIPLSEYFATASEEVFPLNEHYALWEVIKFGDSYKAPQEESDAGSASESSAKKKGKTVAITTKDMQKRRNDGAILKTFGGNEATKKTKKNQLKQKYGNFKAEGSETLQAIVSHLEFMDVEIEQDDLNQKFLTSLASEWLMYTILWRNRGDLDTMSLDDVYNHLKVYEPEVKKKSESNSQNMAFISLAKNSSGKGEVNTASISIASTHVSPASADVATASISHDTVCAYIASQSNGSQIKYEDINQIDEDDIEEMDIKWNMALLSMRANKF
nr:ribonuclease H-like domain-containing protein [Tanacetum cinerariifolium]